jgi:hypothetical protein
VFLLNENTTSVVFNFYGIDCNDIVSGSRSRTFITTLNQGDILHPRIYSGITVPDVVITYANLVVKRIPIINVNSTPT